MAANECNFVPRWIPSRYSFDHFQPCEIYQGSPTVPFFDQYKAVILEAFLWGMGTAIGELPPYFVSRAASLAGKKNEELEEMIDQEKLGVPLTQLPFLDRAKVIMFKTLDKHAFVVVTLCASIPNPLFDLAGLLCGQFLVPFPIFFGATFIGKAIIKTTLQSLFIIFSFSEHHVEHIISMFETSLPSLRGVLSTTIEKQKKALFSESKSDEAKPLIAKVWELFVIGMILYFLMSIINSLVQNYLQEQNVDFEDEKKSKKKRKPKKK
eukprot:CAMPEP_0170552672 /NCGR_PEP_ID=MMETSP0211-20121228/10546_1 /TAXON_ID=311385 /ORGANISM="Pseudokeronopsis sp., Strain OXSARD2" /LENGTH=265 /DNA_ID=CAMNT_0010860543 /DNA_START=397 /DNA_END=1194 /DNA_ORIENTATION=-